MAWFKLKPVPRYLCRVTTTSINEKEFLIASSCLREEGAIHKYNVKHVLLSSKIKNIKFN